MIKRNLEYEPEEFEPDDDDYYYDAFDDDDDEETGDCQTYELTVVETVKKKFRVYAGSKEKAKWCLEAHLKDLNLQTDIDYYERHIASEVVEAPGEPYEFSDV